MEEKVRREQEMKEKIGERRIWKRKKWEEMEEKVREGRDGRESEERRRT